MKQNRLVETALGQGLIFSLPLVLLLQIQAGADLQGRYAPEPPSSRVGEGHHRTDPWARLRALYLPFTEEEERAALKDKKAARRLSGHLHGALMPYETLVEEAARRFRIPSTIIGAVILVESGGDPMAQSGTSSAKGLMQTVKGTFQDARRDLASKGVSIRDDPFNPRSSIMAGAWYLDRMYAQVTEERKNDLLIRDHVASWQTPLEYYYAGPGNGSKKGNLVVIYQGGRRVVIDKRAYSRKVLQWAKIMSKSG